MGGLTVGSLVVALKGATGFNPLNRGMGGLTLRHAALLALFRLSFNPLNRGMGGLTINFITAIVWKLCQRFQSPQSGHGRFNRKEVKCNGNMYFSFCFNPLNRGMGGLTRKKFFFGLALAPAFQSPQSGHGRFNGVAICTDCQGDLMFQSPQSGHGRFNVEGKIYDSSTGVVFQSPQSGHGRFNIRVARY